MSANEAIQREKKISIFKGLSLIFFKQQPCSWIFQMRSQKGIISMPFKTSLMSTFPPKQSRDQYDTCSACSH